VNYCKGELFLFILFNFLPNVILPKLKSVDGLNEDRESGDGRNEPQV
jgi:hypothetical protein